MGDENPLFKRSLNEFPPIHWATMEVAKHLTKHYGRPLEPGPIYTLLSLSRAYGEEARQALTIWMRWYNEERRHQALDYRSPHQYRREQGLQVA